MQGLGVAIKISISAVFIQTASDGFAIFFHDFGQIAFHQTQPVAIALNFFCRIDSSNRIFKVLNGGYRCFQDHIFDASFVGLTDRACCIDFNDNM